MNYTKMTLGEKIRAFDELLDPTVQEFNKMFANCPLKDVTGHVEILDIVCIEASVIRNISTNKGTIRHSFVATKGNKKAIVLQSTTVDKRVNNKREPTLKYTLKRNEEIKEFIGSKDTASFLGISIPGLTRRFTIGYNSKPIDGWTISRENIIKNKVYKVYSFSGELLYKAKELVELKALSGISSQAINAHITASNETEVIINLGKRSRANGNN